MTYLSSSAISAGLKALTGACAAVLLAAGVSSAATVEHPSHRGDHRSHDHHHHSAHHHHGWVHHRHATHHLGHWHHRRAH